MTLSQLLRFAPLASAAWAGAGQACTDGSAMTAYFSYGPPERHGETPLLLVRVTRVEERAVHARLDGSFERLSPDGTVRINLPIPPAGTNCVVLGPTDGPVFVIGTLARYHDGRLVLEATPMSLPPRRRRSAAELNRYIVDPAYLPPASSLPRKSGQ